MSLYAIGDLHLHFQAEVKARGQLTDPIWKNHERVLADNCVGMIRAEDTLMLAGDHSWGKNLAACEQDMAYIMGLPGRKILLRGNHDMFWDVKKTEELNRRFDGKLHFLQNNYYPYTDENGKEYALVGTKGFTFEGPFYLDRRGRVVGWDEEAWAHAEKLVERELERLRQSFERACDDGYTNFIMFLHYPPTSILERDSGFTRMAEEYRAEQVIYAHCHGASRFHDSIQGRYHRIDYRLVSGDFLQWRPVRVL